MLLLLLMMMMVVMMMVVVVVMMMTTTTMIMMIIMTTLMIKNLTDDCSALYWTQELGLTCLESGRRAASNEPSCFPRR